MYFLSIFVSLCKIWRGSVHRGRSHRTPSHGKIAFFHPTLTGLYTQPQNPLVWLIAETMRFQVNHCILSVTLTLDPICRRSLQKNSPLFGPCLSKRALPVRAGPRTNQTNQPFFVIKSSNDVIWCQVYFHVGYITLTMNCSWQAFKTSTFRVKVSGKNWTIRKSQDPPVK
jgi:hypothetical protein